MREGLAAHLQRGANGASRHLGRPRAVLTIGQLLALHAIVTSSRAPGRDGLLAVLDRLIDTYPRPTEDS